MALRTGSRWPDVTQAWRGLRLHSRTPRRRRARDSPAPRPPCGPKLPCAGWLHGSPARCGYGWSPRRSAVRRGMAGAGAWGCVYLHAVGGAAQVLADCIKRVPNVYFMEKFGAPEAIWEFEVVGFPVVVTIDAHGNSLHKEIFASSQAELAKFV